MQENKKYNFFCKLIISYCLNKTIKENNIYLLKKLLIGRKGEFVMNNNTEEFLLLILIGLFASANDINLANNTSILLLFALILFGGNGFNLGFGGNNCCGRTI